MLTLALASCRRDEYAPAPSASASSASKDFASVARAGHLQEELTRANARWQSRPNLGDCATALKEKDDLELCEAAQSSLTAITVAPAATPHAALAVLAPGALALARLSERLRYLSLEELGQRRIEGDAGAPRTEPAPGAVASALAAAPHAHKKERAAHAEERTLQLSESPVSQQLSLTTRLERDVIRNIGGYLEYGSLPVRRQAFETVKSLHAQRPRWPALEHLLRESAVLETDDALKRDLQQLTASGAAKRQLE